jgi:hypothetical protein
MTAPDLERRIRQLPRAEPSKALRERVMSSPVPARQLTWSDRVWFSRAWRLGAAGVLAGVVAVELCVGSPGASRVGPAPQAVAEARALDATGQELGLPEGAASTLAERILVAAVRPGLDAQSERLPRITLEGVPQ